MKIGVDLRVLQVGHQYRGIGEVTRQCLNRVLQLALADGHSFVFYEYDDDIDPKQFLTIPKELAHEEVFLGTRPQLSTQRSLQEKLLTKWRNLFGSPVPHATHSDVLLQFNFDLGVPRRPRAVLVAHDLIPYIFWNDYFESAWVPFRNKAARTTLRTLFANYEYKRVLKRSHRNAWRILCVSDHTRKDLKKYLHVPDRKLRVMHLGVDAQALTHAGGKTNVATPTKPFLLFVGAVDARRRRIDDLIAAFNNLKAQGHDIQLVLVGENFQAPEQIPNEIVRKAVAESSYKNDILALGYVDDATKHALYKQAIAFVFPTIYEGFGIPVLEAMLLECPVIAYKNSSITEVGGGYAFYAKDWTGIWRQAEALLTMPKDARQKKIEAAKKHAQQFSWGATAENMYRALTGK